MKSMMPVIAVFGLVIAVMTFVFEAIIERRHEPNRGLLVGSGGVQRVVLDRNVAGQYIAPGTIDAVPVNFLVDTGADSVAIPEALARRAGLKRGAPVMVSTAGGPSTGYQTVIGELAMGGIVMRDVPALIASGMDGDGVLLGMTFLRHVHFSQRGDQLIIEPPQ